MRRLGALVWGLPRDSATFRALYPNAADWGALEELAAFRAELTHETNRLLHGLVYALGGKKGPAKLPDPLKIPRPGAPTELEKPKPKPATPAEIAAFFGR